MKKMVKILSIMLCLCAFTLVFSACSKDKDDADSGETATLLSIPSEIKVEGYFTEVIVGEDFFINPTIQQKKNGKWLDVPVADYVFECDYDGTKYGEYDFSVYLASYPHVKFDGTVNILPKQVVLPTFSTYCLSQSIN